MKYGQIALSVVLGCALTLGILSLKNPPQGTAAKEESAYERIMRTGTLRCGYFLYPGIIERDVNNGKFSGAYYEIVEEIGKQLSLKIDWAEEIGFANAFDGLKTKRYDVICAPLTQTPGRSRVTEFTIPFIYGPYFAYVRIDDTRFDNAYEKINDPSVKIAFLEGEMSQFVRNEDFPQTQPVSLPQTNPVSDVMLQVVTGKADIAMTEPSTAEAFIVKNPGKLKRVAGPSIRMQPGGLSIGIGEEALKSMLNTTIQAIVNTGFVERVFHKYTTAPDQFFYAIDPWRPAPKKVWAPKQ